MMAATTTTTVMDDTHLRRTETECANCEDGHYMQDGSELICDSCQYSPSGATRMERKSEWQKHREQVDKRANGDGDGRPRLVGGYEDAYWGDGEYEYKPGVGFDFE